MFDCTKCIYVKEGTDTCGLLNRVVDKTLHDECNVFKHKDPIEQLFMEIEKELEQQPNH